jgi:hypothetical protein
MQAGHRRQAVMALLQPFHAANRAKARRQAAPLQLFQGGRLKMLAAARLVHHWLAHQAARLCLAATRAHRLPVA